MFEKALRCFLVLLKTEGPPTNAAFKNVARRELSRQKATHLPEVRVTFRLIKIPVSPQKLPFHPPFEILHLPVGPTGWISLENRPFDAPFAADGDMATVTWSNLMERLKRMGCGVNFKADA